MLELTAYGLFGVAAMLVAAFYFAYANEVATVRTDPSLRLVDEVTMTISRIIRTGTPPIREAMGKQAETASASSLQTTPPAETRPGAIYDDTLQTECGRDEAFRG